MKEGIALWLISGLLSGSFLLRGVGQYNSLVGLDEQANTQWAQVENQYQRRADLIPNLVNTVQGFADQELEVFTEVTRARAAATQTTVDIDDAASLAEFQEAQGELGGALSRLLVTVEAYPELKSDQNFLALQSQLEGTENRISVARMDFNNVVGRFNIAIRRFPINLVAGFFGFDRKPLFEAAEGADQAPVVEFN